MTWFMYFLEGILNLNFYLNLFSTLLLCLLGSQVTGNSFSFLTPFTPKSYQKIWNGVRNWWVFPVCEGQDYKKELEPIIGKPKLGLCAAYFFLFLCICFIFNTISLQTSFYFLSSSHGKISPSHVTQLRQHAAITHSQSQCWIHRRESMN